MEHREKFPMPHPRPLYSLTKQLNPSKGVNLLLHAKNSPFLSIPQNSLLNSGYTWMPFRHLITNTFITLFYFSLVSQSQRCYHPSSYSKQRPGNHLHVPSSSPPSPDPAGFSSLYLLNTSSIHYLPFYLSPSPPILLPTVYPVHKVRRNSSKMKAQHVCCCSESFKDLLYPQANTETLLSC